MQSGTAWKNMPARIVALVMLALFSAGSCATTVDPPVLPGSTARTSSSLGFEFRPGLRVAVLPFTVLGNPDRTIDITEADRLSVKLQEMGFTIIEGLVFQEHSLHLQGLIPEEDWEAVLQILNIDYLVFGTINYAFQPSYSLIGKGRHVPISASVRFVGARSGEVSVIAATERVPGSMAEELGESIKNYFSGN